MADPTTVSGLRGRWRASTISSPPADGAALQTWTETDGSSNADATQATSGNRPVYRSSGAFRPNSKTVVEFSSASSHFMTATLAQNTATTRFMVVRFKTLPNSNMTLTSSPLQVLISQNEKVTTAVEGVTFLVGDNAGTAVLVTDTWYVIAMSDNGSNSNITYVNGTQDASSSTAHTNSGTSLVLGGKVTTGEYLNGYIAEVLDYNSVLSAGDRATVHSYIQDEYGITVSDYVSSNPVIDLSFVASSAWVAPASSASVAPTYPAGIQAGDVVYAELVIKPDTATVATPTNWSLVTSQAVGGGTQGAGTGAVKVHLYKRVASAGHTGSETFTITGGSSPMACMRAFRPQSGATSVAFAESATFYSRTTGSTTFGGTAGANPGIAAKDALVYVSASSDDQSTAHTISALAATGATLGSVTQSPSGTTVNAQGNDISAAAAYALCTAGTASAAPSATVTGSSAETGGGFFYRVRATGIVVAAKTGTASGAFTFGGSASGARTPKGTPSGAYTFGGTGAGKRDPKGTAAGTVAFAGSASGTKPQSGTAAGAFTFAGAAAGSRTPKGSASGAFTFGGAVSGQMPAGGSAAGAVSFAGSAAGKRAPAGSATGAIAFGGTATAAQPKYGTAAGAIAFAGSGNGQRSPKASASGSVAFAGSAQGSTDREGAASGAVSWAGSAAGKRPAGGSASGSVSFGGSASGSATPKGSASGAFAFAGAALGGAGAGGTAAGSVSWAGSASGARRPVAAVTGSVSFAGSAQGSRPTKGTASGSVAWAGAATGERPVVPVASGDADGSVAWAGSAIGQRAPQGAVAGSWLLSSVAVGLRAPVAVVAGSVSWAGSALGSVRHGSATGALSWAGSAVGDTPPDAYEVTISSDLGASGYTAGLDADEWTADLAQITTA